MLKLQLMVGDERREIVVDNDPVIVGRAGDCQIKILDLKSSRHHCRIEKFNGYYRVSDLDTQNGTRVNGSTKVTHDLIKGDEIRIGETTLTVLDLDCVPPAQIAVTVPSPAYREPDPVPMEKKMELRHRIDEMRTRNEGGMFRKVIGAGIGISAALAVLIVLAVVLKEQKPVAPPVSDPLADARKSLVALQTKVAAASAISDDLITDVHEAGLRWNEKWLKAEPNRTTSPFDQLFSTVVVKRAEQFAAKFDQARETVDECITTRQYAKALEVLEKFKLGADTSFEDAVRDLVERLDAIVEADFKVVDHVGRSIEQSRRYDEAGKYYQSQAARFKGTAFYSRISDKPDSLASIGRAEKAAMDRRLADERDRAEAVRKANIIAAAPPPPTPDQKPDPTKPGIKPPAITLSPFLAKVAEFVNAGKFTNRTYKMNDKVNGAPTAAAPEGLTVNGDLVPWGGLATATLLKMASDLFVNDEALLATEFGYANGLAADADKILVRYLSAGDRKERQAKVDQTLARLRGLASVPEGGFAYTDKLGWEDGAQRANRTAIEDALKHLKALVSASDAKKRNEHFTKFFALYSSSDISAENRDQMRVAAVAKLKEWKKKNLDELFKKAKGAGALVQLKGLKTMLNQRREAAIKFIYDEKVYLREDDPRWTQGDKINGQEEVDRLVGLVRDVWEKPSDMVVAGSSSIQKDIDELKEVNDSYLRPLGEECNSAEELKDLEEIMNNLNGMINIQTYCMNGRDNELLNFGRRVDKYNEALKEPGITQSEIAHAKVINDYRSMMGRRRLFLDARLCRATKKHSGVCSAAGKIWHVGADGSPGSRAKAEGFNDGVGENVCLGYSDGDTWTRGWYRASDHHRGGLNESWNCLGYGYSGNVGTENFSNIGTPKGF